jgi:hypothetical protein
MMRNLDYLRIGINNLVIFKDAAVLDINNSVILLVLLKSKGHRGEGE